MKCLPASKLEESNGIGIHDWHAEVLAIRTFNRYLLDECFRLLENDSESPILRRIWDEGLETREDVKPFQIREDVKLYMYCSEAPCMCLRLSRSKCVTNLLQVVMVAWSLQWLPSKTLLHGRPKSPMTLFQKQCLRTPSREGPTFLS